MCQAKKDGGQRCHSHARARLVRAQTAYAQADRAATAAFGSDAIPSVVQALTARRAAAARAVQQATVELASTPKGRAELLERWQALSGQRGSSARREHMELGLHLRAGLRLREDNQAARRRARMTPEQVATEEAAAAHQQADQDEAHRAYERQASQNRSRAAGHGHYINVEHLKGTGGAIRAYRATCSRCGRLAESTQRESAEMSANVHAGQVVDRATATA